ncbi:MAG: preprotein translocase subunit YajC [Clostridiales bacterium]|nr:preprotein translocase subunit YajC [Clostridiales bacterium]
MVSNTFLSAADGVMQWLFVGLLIVLVVVLLVVPMFTNKRRAKQTMDLHNSLIPGDVIKTVGGIIGVIKEIRQVSPSEREMVIETGVGDSKSTMTFDIQALYQILERAPRPDSTDLFDDQSNEHAAEVMAPAEEPKYDEPAEEVSAVDAPVEEKTLEVEKEPVAEKVDTQEPAAEEAATVEAASETPAPAPEKKKAGPSNSGKKKSSTSKNSTKK